MGHAISTFARFFTAPRAILHGIEPVQAIAAWSVIVVFLVIAFLAGRTGVVLLFALASFAALRAFLTLTRHNRADHWSLLACVFIVLPLQLDFVGSDWHGMYVVFVLAFVFQLLVLSPLRGSTTDFLVRVLSPGHWPSLAPISMSLAEPKGSPPTLVECSPSRAGWRHRSSAR